VTFAVDSEVGQRVFQRQQVLCFIVPVKEREPFVGVQIVECLN